MFFGRMPAIRLVTELVAEVEPAALVAVTTTASVFPISLGSSLSEEPVAPLRFSQAWPRALHSCHWYS